jgi:hypothetical protein
MTQKSRETISSLSLKITVNLSGSVKSEIKAEKYVDNSFSNKFAYYCIFYWAETNYANKENFYGFHGERL